MKTTGDSFNEPILATAGYDHSIKIWLPNSAQAVKTLVHNNSQVNCLALTKNSPSPPLLASGGWQKIRLYDMNSNNPIVNFDGVSKNVTAVGFQEDGRFMFTGSEDNNVRIWDMSSQPICQRVFDCSTPATSVSLHPNQVELAISTQGGSIYLWDIKSDNNEQLLPEVNASIQCVDISPNGKYMAAINNKGMCYIWSLLNNTNDKLTKTEPKLKFKTPGRYGLKCKFSPDSNFLVTTSADSTARIYKTTNDFELYRELKVDNNRWVWDALFSNDSKYLFTASSDCYARLWKIETKTIEKEYIGHSKALTAMAFRDEFVRNT